MSSEYSLGKDISTIQQSLTSIDGRLAAIERQLSCHSNTHSPDTSVYSDVSPIVIPSETTPTDADLSGTGLTSFGWIATDESSSHRVLIPGGNGDVVFFAYMLDRAQFTITDFNKITAAIWPVVFELSQNDLSAKQLHTYRPINKEPYNCVLGHYMPTAKLWSWIIVSFTQSWDNPRSRFSSSYNMRGELITAYQSWVTLRMNLVGGYKYNIPYADCDDQNGLEFSFQNFYL